MSSSFTYPNPRPTLTVAPSGGGQLGNCYSSMTYTVTSLVPLSMAALRNIRKAGCLGYGQEFYAKLMGPDGSRSSIPEKLDYPENTKVIPTGVDSVICVEVRDGKRVDGVAVNPYSKEPYKPMTVPYFVYECENRVDSSD